MSLKDAQGEIALRSSACNAFIFASSIRSVYPLGTIAKALRGSKRDMRHQCPMIPPYNDQHMLLQTHHLSLGQSIKAVVDVLDCPPGCPCFEDYR